MYNHSVNLFNTNEQFDYGGFRELAELQSQVGTATSLFTYRFTEPGVYVFQLSSNSEKKMVSILCLIPRTTVSSLSAPNDVRCKTHPIYASIPGFFFEHVRKQTCYAHDKKHLLLEYALKSLSFLNRDPNEMR